MFGPKTQGWTHWSAVGSKWVQPPSRNILSSQNVPRVMFIVGKRTQAGTFKGEVKALLAQQQAKANYVWSSMFGCSFCQTCAYVKALLLNSLVLDYPSDQQQIVIFI